MTPNAQRIKERIIRHKYKNMAVASRSIKMSKVTPAEKTSTNQDDSNLLSGGNG